MFPFGKKQPQQPSHYDQLSERWTKKHKALQERLWEKHGNVIKQLGDKTKHFAAGSLAGLMLMASPGAAMTASAPKTVQITQPFTNLDMISSFLLQLNGLVPRDVRPLSPDEEQKIGTLLSSVFHMKISAELDGIRLNRSYGYIGQEQHLMRYPGDSMDSHFTSKIDAAKYYQFGMAPGLGAYGYFAKSAGSMTQEQSDREKYYVAVQTFLAPGYLENTKKMNQFFAFHKMLVVNPENGRAVVADIGDSGPSEWTGKSAGGSPEVMNYLERVDGAQKGPVLYFFIDDPNDTIPLGPVNPS